MKFTFLIVIVLTIFSNSVSAKKDSVWRPWMNLANLKPQQNDLQEARKKRHNETKNYDIQKISEGSGNAINIDEYIVQIDSLPNSWSSSQLFMHVRHNLNSFLDQKISKFRPHSEKDRGDWKEGAKAKLGTIMVFEISLSGFATDNAAVVVSQVGNSSWIFSPIDDGLLGDFGTHPVAGNRQFSMRSRNGKIEFVTRGFDRVYPVHVAAAEGVAFEGADKLWKSFQKNLVAYVNKNGGSAIAITPNVPGGNDPKKKPQYADVCADSDIKLKC